MFKINKVLKYSFLCKKKKAMILKMPKKLNLYYGMAMANHMAVEIGFNLPHPLPQYLIYTLYCLALY